MEPFAANSPKIILSQIQRLVFYDEVNTILKKHLDFYNYATQED